MTVQNKTTIKSYFEAGDKPTAAQFADLVDSYQDASNSLISVNQVVSAASSEALLAVNGSQGVFTPSAVSALSLIGGVGLSIVTAKGDLIVGTSVGNVSRLPVGTEGQLVTPISSSSTGFVWNDRNDGFRNRLINGDISVDQKNNGSSQTFTAAAALAYCVDKWYGYCTGANVTGQQTTGGNTAQYKYRFTGAASVASIGFGQRIRQLDSYDLAGSTATLSVNLANSLLGTVTWTAYYANSVDTFGSLASPSVTQIATGTFNVTSTISRYSTQISIPSAATTGIQIVFTVGAQISGTWDLQNIQLEKGSVATSFAKRAASLEIFLCENTRIRQNSNSTAQILGSGISTGPTSARIYIKFRERLRASPSFSVDPTFSKYAILNGSASIAGTISNITLVDTTVDGAQIEITTSSGLTAGQATFLVASSGSTAYLEFSADL